MTMPSREFMIRQAVLSTLPLRFTISFAVGGVPLAAKSMYRFFTDYEDALGRSPDESTVTEEIRRRFQSILSQYQTRGAAE